MGRELADNYKRYNLQLKATNREATKQTVENTRKKILDDDDVNSNYELLAAICGGVQRSEHTKDLMRTLLNAKTKEELEKRGDMVYWRNFLASLLNMFGNGQRPGTLENMTIEEFNQAQTVQEVEVVFVSKHKTAKASGAAPVSFPMPGLWKGVAVFIKFFR